MKVGNYTVIRNGIVVQLLHAITAAAEDIRNGDYDHALEVLTAYSTEYEPPMKPGLATSNLAEAATWHGLAHAVPPALRTPARMSVFAAVALIIDMARTSPERMDEAEHFDVVRAALRDYGLDLELINPELEREMAERAKATRADVCRARGLH